MEDLLDKPEVKVAIIIDELEFSGLCRHSIPQQRHSVKSTMKFSIQVAAR